MIDVKKMCSEKGLRMTEQRNTIADVITEMSMEGHPDVNEIFLCANKKDKTKAGYWACNLPRYAKQVGLSGGGNFFW